MAIKDELLEAFDPSLDKLDEDLDSMWIIIPIERRYDNLTAFDYLQFARKYGTFNNQKDCIERIEELAPNRWDAFIPMKLQGVNESLKEDLNLNEYGELQGSNTIAYDKGWEHYESDDMPAGGVWLVKSFETDEGDLEGEIQADSNGVYAAVYKSNGSQVFSKDDFDNIGQAVLTIERVVNDRYNHYYESLNESMSKTELTAKKYIIAELNRSQYSKIASLLKNFEFHLTENPDVTGYIDLNTKQVVLNTNLSTDDAIKCIVTPLRNKAFKQALKDPKFIQWIKDTNKEVEKYTEK